MDTKKILYIMLYLFAILSFVSIAAGNIFLGIAVLFFLMCVYKKKAAIDTDIKYIII